MARRTETAVIEAAGRDKGKAFFLTEMPASKAEAWALRMLIALSRSGMTIPEEVMASGWAGVALFGLRGLSGLAYEEVEPLLAEMMACVQFVPNPAKPAIMRALVEDDIEEVVTIAYLRARVFDLHASFSKGASLSALLAPKEKPGS